MRALAIACTILTFVACGDSATTTTDTGPGSDATASPCGRPPLTDFPFEFEGSCYGQPPSSGAKRTQCGEIVDDCDTSGTTNPNLACYGTPPSPPAGPTSFTLAGYIDVFSSGPDSDGVIVQVYDADALEAAVIADIAAGTVGPGYFPTSVQPLGTDTVALDLNNLGSPPSPPTDPVRGAARACPADEKKRLKCEVPVNTCGGANPFCLLVDDYCASETTTCEDLLRWEGRYRIENIPSNKRLYIRTLGANGFGPGTWGIMLTANVYLFADAAACADGQVNDCINAAGEYEFEANALSQADYSTIPITAGLSGGIPAGKGAVAGDIHDCDDIKLEGVQISTTPAASVVVYFNGNPVDTLPDLGRFSSGSNADGLFGALDIAPGLVSVGTVGMVSNQPTSAGSFQVLVVPDTVTVLGFDGPLPQ